MSLAVTAHKNARFNAVLKTLAETCPEACELFKEELLERLEKTATEIGDEPVPMTQVTAATPDPLLSAGPWAALLAASWRLGGFSS